VSTNEETYNDIRRRLGFTAEDVARVTGAPLKDCRAYGMVRPYGRRAPRYVVDALRSLLRQREAESLEAAPAAKGGE